MRRLLPGEDVLDSFSQHGAEELAHRIRHYWLSRGYEVDVRVGKVRIPKGYVARIESDLVNGMPRRKAAELLAMSP